MESISALEIDPKQPISSPEESASLEEIKIRPPFDGTKPVPTMPTAQMVPPIQPPVFIQATLTAPIVTTATTTPNNIIAPPDNFNGRPTSFRSFWTAAMAFMTANPSSFTDDTVKILFILTHCKLGIAGPWGTVKMEHYANTAWPTWDAFKKLFVSTFYL